MSELAAYDVMSKIAIIALKRVTFGFLQPFPCIAVSKCRFVLQCKQDLPASTDLNTTECTKLINSVHIITMRFDAKLRVIELVVGKMAINVDATTKAGNAKYDG